MRTLIFFISIFISIKTILYGVFEFKNEQNKYGGITVIALGILAFILPSVTILIR